jgi:hypothetical protein
MKEFEIEVDRMQKLTDEEKMWCNHLFRFLYGNKEVRRKNGDLMTEVYITTDKLKLAKKPVIRKIINFLRNGIVVNHAGKVARCDSLNDLPESYKSGTFWIDATSNGYLATTDTDKIDKHIKTLISRRNEIDKDISSARLVIKALKRLEAEK